MILKPLDELQRPEARRIAYEHPEVRVNGQRMQWDLDVESYQRLRRLVGVIPKVEQRLPWHRRLLRWLRRV